MLRDPHSFADTRQGRIRHIDFELDVDFTTHTIRGRAEYALEGHQRGPLFLDIRGLVIKSVQADGRALEWEIDESDRVRGQRLHIRDSEPRLAIEFETAPQASALGWLEPSQTAGGKHPFLFSQCQAIHARSVFPCQDTPSVRFTYTAKVTVPAPLSAAMAASSPTSVQRGDRIEHSFDMPQAVPSYLFALAAGNFAFRSMGPRSGVFAEPEMVEQAAWEFASTEGMIDAAEKLFGPYLWETFNMLVMPPSFPYGGMENPRLAFMTPSLIVGDRSMVNVVGHELAHSWTGNLVTNATWEDFWLNEGWTVYAERRLLEVLEGDAYAQLHGAVRRGNLLEDMKIFGMEADATKLKFSQEGVDPDEVFSMVPYEKGCSFLTLIEQVVGRPRFDAFIHSYIETFRFQSLTTDDFLTFLNKELPEVASKVDIQRWVFGPGLPEDAVVPTSPLLDDVYRRIAEYEKGKLPDKAVIARWKPQQIEIFLKNMPRQIPVEHCKQLWDILALQGSRNRNLLTEYCSIAIRSGYEEILGTAEGIVANIGRMLYLKPIYRALAETAWSKAHARPIFERYRGTYHPIAVIAIDRLLQTAGV